MSEKPEPGEAHIGHCRVCGKPHPLSALLPFAAVRPALSEIIARTVPGWQDGALICRDDLARSRRAYVENLLEKERGELGGLDRQVIDSLQSGQILSQDTETMSENRATFGERTADRVAAFGGSWTFILLFLAIIVVWMAGNAAFLVADPFDPYPFILLNLLLSTLAALQAPVIMMSQRRQETKDRLRADNDYRVNLKAELEIRQLHEKLDHQMARQWEKLAALQQVQIDLLEERVNGRN